MAECHQFVSGVEKEERALKLISENARKEVFKLLRFYVLSQLAVDSPRDIARFLGNYYGNGIGGLGNTNSRAVP